MTLLRLGKTQRNGISGDGLSLLTQSLCLYAQTHTNLKHDIMTKTSIRDKNFTEQKGKSK